MTGEVQEVNVQAVGRHGVRFDGRRCRNLGFDRPQGQHGKLEEPDNPQVHRTPQKPTLATKPHVEILSNHLGAGPGAKNPKTYIQSPLARPCK